MADMTDLRRALAERVQEIAEEALEETWRETIDAAPEKTGALKQLTDTDPPRPLSEFSVLATIFCEAEYAEWTDAGSHPHRITGRPWLAFYWEAENVDVVFSSRDGGPAYVNHPGSPGTRWFNGGRDGGEPMRSRWERACERAAAA
jgi:hypothetical protein